MVRFILAPIRELVLAVKDARSPEMREAEDHRKLVELGRDGEGWYIAKRTAAITLVVESFIALKTVGDVLAGKMTWQQLQDGDSFLTFFVTGIVCVIIGAFVGSHEIGRLRERYGGDDPPPPPPPT
jgi:hypothetical protein